MENPELMKEFILQQNESLRTWQEAMQKELDESEPNSYEHYYYKGALDMLNLSVTFSNILKNAL